MTYNVHVHIIWKSGRSVNLTTNRYIMCSKRVGLAFVVIFSRRLAGHALKTPGFNLYVYIYSGMDCTNVKTWISSYQFIISLTCSYMFRQLCSILREHVCTFWGTCQFGFWLIKFSVICIQPHTTENSINQKPKLANNSEGTGQLPEDGI
jgi:hypothetical protein